MGVAPAVSLAPPPIPTGFMLSPPGTNNFGSGLERVLLYSQHSILSNQIGSNIHPEDNFSLAVPPGLD